jgi:ABC-type molybdate transport system substrate-binding protein
MRIIILAATVLLITGCAASVITSNERMVMVHAGSLDAKKAMDLAQTECAKYHRHARLTAKPDEDMQWVFDCIQ